jgi:hypothetical protein
MHRLLDIFINMLSPLQHEDMRILVTILRRWLYDTGNAFTVKPSHAVTSIKGKRHGLNKLA